MIVANRTKLYGHTKMKACLHQIFKPTTETRTPIEGCGDCQTCTYDERNKECSRFYEINYTQYKVRDTDDLDK